MITPHKGGRTERAGFRCTKQEKTDLETVLSIKNMSLADWVSQKVTEDIETMNKNEIVERLGATNWEQVQTEYNGYSEKEILADLSHMWPHESTANKELATAIDQEKSK